MTKFIEITFDISNHVGQKAKVDQDLLVSEMIDEILTEFDELDTSDRQSFALYPLNKKSFLNPSQSLKSVGVEHMDHLILATTTQPPNFKMFDLPKAIHAELFLKQTNQNFPIKWYPALIGSYDHNTYGHDSLVVDLTSALDEKETRISRRHVEISFRGNRFYLRVLSKKSKTHLRGKKVNFGDEVRLINDDKIDLAEGTATFIFRMKEDKHHE